LAQQSVFEGGTRREASLSYGKSKMVRPAIFSNANLKPLEKILGHRTRWLILAPARVRSFILGGRRYSRQSGIQGYEMLADGPELVERQIRSLQEMMLEPHSYYDGQPIFKRLPSVPEFAFRLHRDDSTLDLLVDLHNPGWEFHCEHEFYRDWSWVGSEMKVLAKELFPALASGSSRSVWKRGAIKALQRMNDADAT
jgi:hypothetical protein